MMRLQLYIVTDDVSSTPKSATGYDREPAVFFRVCACTCESADPPPTFERACATRVARETRLVLLHSAYNQSAGAAHP